jgi:hypothetical protein
MTTPIRSHWLQLPVPPPYRIPLLVLGFMALVVGVLAGLRRLAFDVPLPSPGLIALHGPLMVSGFFGTLISLERAVALGARWTYGGPLFAALGAAAVVAGAPVWIGALLLSLGSAFLAAASLAVFLRQRAVFTATLLAGALCWLVGNLAWLPGLPLTAVVPWWAGFLVLTIAGERLELSRFLAPPAAAQRAFVGIVTALLAGFALLAAGVDRRGLFAAGALLALTVWLARYDIARRTVHDTGLTRFIAVALLSGYVWLGAAAVIAIAAGGLFVAPFYDATLHAVFLGFVFSMVFGHAPIILPAVTHLAVRFHPAFYLHLALLHLSLAARLAGDLTGSRDWRGLGALLNAVALLVFVANTAVGVWRGRRKGPVLTPREGARI